MEEQKDLEELVDKLEEETKEKGIDADRNAIRLVLSDHLHSVGEGLD